MIPVFHLDLNVTIRLMTALNKKLFFILSVLIYYFIHISNDALLDSLNQKKICISFNLVPNPATHIEKI